MEWSAEDAGRCSVSVWVLLERMLALVEWQRVRL